MDKEELKGFVDDAISNLESATSEIEDAINQLESVGYELEDPEEDGLSTEKEEVKLDLNSASTELESAISSIESAISSLYIAEEDVAIPSEGDKAAKGDRIHPASRHLISSILRVCAIEVELGDYDSAVDSIERAQKAFDLLAEEAHTIASKHQNS